MKKKKVKETIYHEAGHALFDWIWLEKSLGRKKALFHVKESTIIVVSLTDSKTNEACGMYTCITSDIDKRREKDYQIFKLLGGIVSDYCFMNSIDFDYYFNRLYESKAPMTDINRIIYFSGKTEKR